MRRPTVRTHHGLCICCSSHFLSAANSGAVNRHLHTFVYLRVVPSRYIPTSSTCLHIIANTCIIQVLKITAMLVDTYHLTMLFNQHVYETVVEF